MHIPFRIGSDGATCWFVGKDKRIAVPSQAIEEKSLLFVDPFHAKDPASASAMICDWKLDYAGTVDLNGRQCHLIRSWNVTRFGPVVTLGLRWYIDAKTLLPVRVASGDAYTVDYTYSRLNEAIPDDEFRPPAGVQAGEPEPLPGGYTRRFLNAIDGSSGRMSVRWGMKGPKGVNSSGLN
jgi:hypothetical protein